MENKNLKKTAVVLFPHFCHYEISVLLEILAMNEKPVTFFASTLSPFRCEEGMQVIADTTFDNCVIEEYDSLVISGSYAEGLYINFADKKLLDFIRLFNEHKKLLAAISSGPMVLCKADIMAGKKFTAAVERDWFLTDPNMTLTTQQLEGLIDVNDLKNIAKNGDEEPDFIHDDNILTAVGWKFREWSIAYGRILNLKVWPRSFGNDLS